MVMTPSSSFMHPKHEEENHGDEENRRSMVLDDESSQFQW